ncbi:hypothetical protein SpCBS45565_g02901 [Spizellomyces sp. 'palustris']|nr:hypothetical protein SpCBS45565_g02901 [Spizellomyces sp. 'palustris']
MTTLKHPYYPSQLDLPHYTVPTMPMQQILTIFFSTVFVILLTSYSIISRSQTTFGRKLVFLWFISCGFIHWGLEGYFAYNHKEIAGQSFVLAQLWKEYAYSDSRYMSGDSFVVVMESVTAFLWGPLSFLTAYLIFNDSPVAPILEFLVSTGQLYGDVLYYATTLIEGAPHCSPSPFHFWFYFVFMNAFWIVIPLTIMWNSARRMHRAMCLTQGKGKGKLE